MSALKDAIIATPSLDSLRLRALAYKAMQAAAMNPHLAVESFLTEVRRDRAILYELVGDKRARSIAFAYLEAATLDMKHESECGEAHHSVDRHDAGRSSPSDPNSETGEAQLTYERQPSHRPPVSEPHSEAEGAQCVFDRHGGHRPLVSEPQDERKHSSDVSANPKVASVRPPAPAARQGAELSAIKAIAPKSAFDSIKLRDGTPIGDLRWNRIDRMIGDNRQEAALLSLVRDYAQPGDQQAKIKDIVPLGEFERMVQRSVEALRDAGPESTECA